MMYAGNVFSTRLPKKKKTNFSGFVVKKPRMVFTLYMAVKRVSMGLTDRRKTEKNLVDSRKN